MKLRRLREFGREIGREIGRERGVFMKREREDIMV